MPAATVTRPAANKRAQGPTTTGPVTLLVSTIKGAFQVKSNADRTNWTCSEPKHFGHEIYHYVADPRDPKRRIHLVAAKTGHLGPTIYWSLDGGKTYSEAAAPPRFPARKGEKRTVQKTFWLTPGHVTEPGVWYCGCDPGALFRSTDNGNTWEGVDGWNNSKKVAGYLKSAGASPGGLLLHSLIISVDDPRHMYLSISAAGTFESSDAGQNWAPLNSGVAMDFAPPKTDGSEYEVGHDPHCMVQSQVMPERLYQQNHCGIYRLTRPEKKWTRIGDNMPREVGDIGFPIAVHPRNPDMIWVVPMDGTSVWPRTSVGGKPAVFRSRNAGDKWQRLDKGLPKKGWLTVFRQALANDAHDPVGIYFGTTSGELYASSDEGSSWTRIVEHLPRILAVEVQ